MKKFVVTDTADPDENPFDRQERITWWSQQKISAAKVMVVGAGAIGNETLKNLALLGFKDIFIVDFDTISTSNLSRTVLFRREDKGLKKAQVAAQRTAELCLADNARIDWFDGDVVWDLGTGVFREMDVVLGCLDNAETRFAINRQCWLAQTPWIDAGIFELAGSVSLYLPNAPPCYQCGASTEQIEAARRRYSCDDFKQSLVAEGKAPTVQIASAIASALQVQEAVKLLCGQEAAAGQRIFFQGKKNEFALLRNPINAECLAHATYPEVISLPLDREVALGEFLGFVSQDSYSGKGATLDFRGDRSFVLSAPCIRCGQAIELFKPAFQLYQHEIICSDCAGSADDAQTEVVAATRAASKVTSDTFSLEESGERLLRMSLRELGVPRLHVVAVKDRHDSYQYYELAGDKKFLLPNMA
jgi:molybdopterin/thiamine biosynthesis adenylyltransferase